MLGIAVSTTVALVVLSTNARAAGLSLHDALDAALKSDPVLQAADAQRRADREALPQARAGLLPRLSVQSTASSNTTTTRLLSGSAPESSAEYLSRSQSLALNQPLFRASAWMNFRRAEVATQIAHISYESASQQAIDRVVSAYLDVLRLDREVIASAVEVEAKTRRLVLMRQLFDAGQASLVDRQSAEVDQALEIVRRSDLQAQLGTARRELERLTGKRGSVPVAPAINHAPGCLRDALAALRLELNSVEMPDIELHPVVVLHRLRLEQAVWETRKRSSDHFPTVDLVASVNRGASASEITIGREINTRFIGVQVNVPVFSGGGVSASVREALALQEKAEIELYNARANIENDRERARAQIQVAVARLAAELASLEAATTALELESRRYEGRLASVVDLLGAQSKVEAASSRVYAALSKSVTEYARLRISTGSLNAESMLRISAALSFCTGSSNQ